MAANLSEGFGRYHYKENKQFCCYGRGSLYETKIWLKKAANRGLVPKETFERFECDINTLGRRLNTTIKSIGADRNLVKESHAEWAADAATQLPMTSDQ